MVMIPTSNGAIITKLSAMHATRISPLLYPPLAVVFTSCELVSSVQNRMARYYSILRYTGTYCMRYYSNLRYSRLGRGPCARPAAGPRNVANLGTSSSAPGNCYKQEIGSRDVCTGYHEKLRTDSGVGTAWNCCAHAMQNAVYIIITCICAAGQQ